MRDQRSGKAYRLVALLALLLTVVGISAAAPANAASKSYVLAADYGRGGVDEQPNTSTRSLRLVIFTNDGACDSHEVQLRLAVHLDGGETVFSNWYTESDGCGHLRTDVKNLSVGDLKGHRSGYITAELYKHSGIHYSGKKTASWPWSI